MPIDSLIELKKHSPELFKDCKPPESWSNDLIFIPIDKPEGLAPDEMTTIENPFGAPDSLASPNWLGIPAGDWDFPRGGWGFPGGVAPWRPGEPHPPPDALAFYLPFHYFMPDWWGVYIILEGAFWLGREVHGWCGGHLTPNEALVASRIYLYGHEAYHHGVEMLATRLEVTHRTPVYKAGFQSLYNHTAGTDDWAEEALATGQGLRKVKAAFSKKPAKAKHALMDGFADFVRKCPPGYRRGAGLEFPAAFKSAEAAFAEQNQRACFPGLPSKDKSVWGSFPYAVAGMSRRTSRVNYVVHRSSPLSRRFGLDLRYLRYREVTKKLKELAGCEPIRQGSGSHEIWKTPSGETFPVPRHPGDLTPGTLRKIIKQAGLDMGLEEFARA